MPNIEIVPAVTARHWAIHRAHLPLASRRNIPGPNVAKPKAVTGDINPGRILPNASSAPSLNNHWSIPKDQPYLNSRKDTTPITHMVTLSARTTVCVLLARRGSSFLTNHSARPDITKQIEVLAFTAIWFGKIVVSIR